MPETQTRQTYRDRVRRTLWIVLFSNLLVAAAKLIVGLLIRSLAMVADGFHSSLDASSNIIGLIGNAIAARPPDESHPYGHERFETIASLAIGALLLTAAIEILRGVVNRLASGGAPQVTPVSLLVMVITLVVNLITLTYERRSGNKLNSELLLTDAAHTQVDVWVSLSVIASLVAVALGVIWIDILAAIAIVGLIAVTALEILRRTANVLVDGAATNPQPIQSIVSEVAGVSRVTHVRSRGPQGAIHVDVDVDVDAAMTTDHSHNIAQEIQRRVLKGVTGIGEVEVHFTPIRSPETSPPDYLLASRAEADALGLTVHEVVPIETASGIVLDMHVEMDGALSLDEAHVQATELEQRVQKRLEEVVDVITHIEPSPSGELQVPYNDAAQAIRHKVLRKAHELYPDANWHDIRLRQDGKGFALSLHCHLPGEVTLDHAHSIAERVETKIRADIPEITRVTIHTEPSKE